MIFVIGLLTAVGALLLSRRAIIAATTIAAAAVVVLFATSFLAPGRPEPVEIIAGAVRAEGSNIAVCACGAFARSLNFYTHAPVEIANVTPDSTDELRRFLDRPDRVLAVVDWRALVRVEESLGTRFPRITEVLYVNTSVWQRGESLRRFDPADVQRVLLIANR
jgi:hypothetical protein